jgi:putative heme-binding domain-containing protein
MAWRALCVVAGWCIVSSTWAHAQAPAAKNPLEGDATAIRSGMGLFRARCADCHGMDARGVRGPDITQVWASGRSDEGLFMTIKNGITGTEMPAQPRLFEHETWQILAYLKTLAATARSEPPRGDAVNGEKIYQANCASCHRVNGAGGRLGPDLSRIGVARSREVLELRIRGGVEGFLPGYEPVTLTPESGQAVVGVKKNEDLFSVQIMDTRERIQGYDKSSLKQLQNNPRSAMPAFGSNRISESDLDDLIRYLQTLRGFNPTVVQ